METVENECAVEYHLSPPSLSLSLILPHSYPLSWHTPLLSSPLFSSLIPNVYVHVSCVYVYCAIYLSPSSEFPLCPLTCNVRTYYCDPTTNKNTAQKLLKLSESIEIIYTVMGLFSLFLFFFHLRLWLSSVDGGSQGAGLWGKNVCVCVWERQWNCVCMCVCVWNCLHLCVHVCALECVWVDFILPILLHFFNFFCLLKFIFIFILFYLLGLWWVGISWQ